MDLNCLPAWLRKKCLRFGNATCNNNGLFLSESVLTTQLNRPTHSFCHLYCLYISSSFSNSISFFLQAMAMMGLYDTAYWLSWLTWEGIITLLSSLFTVLFGMMFQFDFFLNNSFAVVFLVFFLFQLNMVRFLFVQILYSINPFHIFSGSAFSSFGYQVGFAFLFSSFISKSTSSTAVGFSVYIVGFLTQVSSFLITFTKKLEVAIFDPLT